MPGTYNLALYRGDSYSWRFTLWADDAQTDPLSLTGATVAAEIRNAPGGATVIELDCTIASPNHIDVELTTAMWSTIPATGVWDLEVTFADDTVRTVVAGTVAATPDVTGSGAALLLVTVPTAPLTPGATRSAVRAA